MAEEMAERWIGMHGKSHMGTHMDTHMDTHMGIRRTDGRKEHDIMEQYIGTGKGIYGE